MTILYLIRHGETGGNYEGRFQGIIDNPLNEYGIRQAKMLGEAFSLSKIDVLYTSPLQRAKKTAEIIAEMHGLEKLVSNCGSRFNKSSMEDCWKVENSVSLRRNIQK